jgi:Xaa-Pro dipeptidase
MNEHTPQLSAVHCRTRQRLLADYLSRHRLDAAVTANRHYVHALTGYWHEQPLTHVAAVVTSDADTTLVCPGDDPRAPAADNHRGFAANQCSTLVENQLGALAEAVLPLIANCRAVGTTDVAWPWLCEARWTDITSDYQSIRRTKLADEIEMLRYAIAAADAVYQCAKATLREGTGEVELYARLLATATESLGEPLSGWGQDFQFGTPGGFPRSRAAVAGELAILDIGVGFRGYRCDLSRTFAISGEATPEQTHAHQRILEAFESIESRLTPGLSCRGLYDSVHEMLDGWNGYSFFHHLGHGIGLDAHEVPRLNPNWDDALAAGDVIAVEPGLYGDPLHGGIRLEQDYLITDDGFERLSNFPLDLC